MDKKHAAYGVTLIYLPLLLVFSLFTYLGCYLGESQWVLGLILMAIAIPTAIFGGKFKPLYILGILLNAAGSGIIASYYFTYFSLTLTLNELIVPFLISAAFIVLCALAIRLCPSHSLLVCVFAGILDLIVLIFTVVCWCISGGVFYPLVFFDLVLVGVGIVLFGVEATSEENELLRDAAFSSFGVLLLVGLLVAILVGGDGCDCDAECCDCDSIDTKKRKKNK